MCVWLYKLRPFILKLNEAGNLAVFDGPNSFVRNKGTAEISYLRMEDGNVMLDVWVAPPVLARGRVFLGIHDQQEGRGQGYEADECQHHWKQ